MKSDILFLDIETQPNLAYVWGKYQQDVLEFKQEWIIIGFSVKYLNGKTHTYALPDFPGYKPGTEDDKALVQKIWNYLDEAEIVCGHNGRDFDIKKINARFAFHGMNPPTPYKVVDTLQAARKYFGFTSNKLDDLGRYLKIGRKVPNGGFKLWLDCIAGDKKAWKLMKKYNEYDVILLEKLYKKLLPFIGNHPPMGMYNGKPFSCPNCGSDHLQSRGTQISKTGKTQRYQCQSCATWCKTAVSIPGTKKPLVPI
jgi:DNA polymerase III epsilon subunit-like protein